jgi:hypothetical protein
MKTHYFLILFVLYFYHANAQSNTGNFNSESFDCEEHLLITEDVILDGIDNQSASKTIEAYNKINRGALVNYNAKIVYLKTGFHAKYKSNFKAFIDESCTDLSLSILENYTEFSIKIYPNPSQNFLIVTTNNKAIAYYSIIDQLGKSIVKSQAFVNPLNIEKLHSGFYFIKFQLNNGKFITKKIIKG